MASFLIDFLPLLAAQRLGRCQMPRKPEEADIMTDEQSVLQYNAALHSKLALAYAAGIEVIHRTLSNIGGTSALDLACGPGLGTICLAKHLGCERVIGVDLSERMLAAARENALRAEVHGKVEFARGDVTLNSPELAATFDLVTFSHAAHHLPTIESVSRVLRRMEQYARPDGLIMIMDLVRLKTEDLNRRFANTAGRDYEARGLVRHLADFHSSLRASWTVAELRSAVPHDTQRRWCHLVPLGLPMTQVLLGLPAARTQVFVRSGWGVKQHPLFVEWVPRWRRELGAAWTRETLREARLYRLALFWGKRHIITGGHLVQPQPLKNSCC